MKGNICIENHQVSLAKRYSSGWWSIGEDAALVGTTLYRVKGLIIPCDEKDLRNSKELINILASNSGANQWCSEITKVGLVYEIQAYGQSVDNFLTMIKNVFLMVKANKNNLRGE